MKSTQRGLPAIFSTVFLFILLAVIWFNFAPTKMGGQAIYVIVDGTSMLPGFHLGDLVILRDAPDYQIGDIATYNNSEMGGYVIHRIIAVDQDHFIFKGDNNAWIDAYTPTRAELIGKLWVHIPKIGLFIQWLRVPLNTALIACLLGGILMASFVKQPQKNGKNHAKKASHNAGPLEWLLYLFGIPALACLVLGVFAFTRPLLQNADNIAYQQQGVFSYSASGTPGVYDADTVHTGEPIFPALTCSLNLAFAYNLIGGTANSISGSQQLYARVLDEQSGWGRTIPLNAETAFSGSTYTANATLDLCQVEALISEVEQKTGFHPNTYTLDVISHVSVSGTLSGQEFRDTIEPSLRFRFDKLHFYLVAVDAKTDPLQSLKKGSVSNPTLLDNTLPLLGFDPRIGIVRILSVVGFLLCMLGLVVVGTLFYSSATSSPGSLIQIKYGALIVDAYDKGLETISPIIDVVSIDDLAKIAERQNSMILRMSRDSVHYYLVQNNGATYRYVNSDGKKPEWSPIPQVKPSWGEI